MLDKIGDINLISPIYRNKLIKDNII